MTTQSDIQKMADIIAEKFHPEKIILFGSHARGVADKDSDVDLLVVMETEECGPNRSTPLRASLWGTRASVDIHVRTPKEFQEDKDLYFTLSYPASKEGVVVYEQRNRSRRDAEKRMPNLY